MQHLDCHDDSIPVACCTVRYGRTDRNERASASSATTTGIDVGGFIDLCIDIDIDIDTDTDTDTDINIYIDVYILNDIELRPPEHGERGAGDSMA